MNTINKKEKFKYKISYLSISVEVKRMKIQQIRDTITQTQITWHKYEKTKKWSTRSTRI